jgi:hypothetical protein
VLGGDDPLLPKPVRAASTPAKMVNGAGRGRLGVVRGCPFATGKDRCEWQANGMAAEDDPGIRLRRWRHPDRTVRSVLGEECLVGKSPEGTVRPTTDEAPILAVVTTPALRSSTTSGQSALPSPASRSSRVGRLPCLLWTRRNWAIQANLYLAGRNLNGMSLGHIIQNRCAIGLT